MINGATLVRNYGLELPVFDNSEPIIRSNHHVAEQFAAAEASGQNTALRQVRVSALGVTSLKELVETSDLLFEADADSIGARVVEHEWGLYKVMITRGRYLIDRKKHEQLGLLPPHHILAARVALINVTDKISTEQDKIFKITPFNRVNGFRWADRKSHQFVNGIPRGGDIPSLWLIDIEPVFFYKN